MQQDTTTTRRSFTAFLAASGAAVLTGALPAVTRLPGVGVRSAPAPIGARMSPAPLLSYAELGLPDDHLPTWEQMEITSFADMLAFLADEIWIRSAAPLYTARVALAEYVDRSEKTGLSALTLDSARMELEIDRANQAALAGFAAATVATRESGHAFTAPSMESWCQQTMAAARIAVMPASRRKNLDRVARVAWGLPEEA